MALNPNRGKGLKPFLDEDALTRFPVERLYYYEVSPDGCWIWQRSVNKPLGYGKAYAFGAAVLVHRAAYSVWVGRIPDGYEVDHLCNVRSCINPEHLEAVTPAENRRRQIERRLAARNGECLYGHNDWRWKMRRGERHRACRSCAINASKGIKLPRKWKL